MAKKRITELTEATTVKPGHYIPVDHGTDGTQKMSMSTLIDSTLSTSGKAADAKATGDSITELDARMDTFTSLPSGSTSGDAELMDIRVGADGTTYQSAGSAVRGQISEIKEELQEIIDGGGGSGMTEEFKQALHNILQQLVYISADGQTYLDALDNALWPPTDLVSISAVFTQGQNIIYDTDSLDTLKQFLVVTAHYSDSTSETVTTYSLSGTLTSGTSVITVSYQGKTTTFNVAVTEMYVKDGLVMWLDGERNGVGGVHENTLTTWVDQSGNGWDWTNSGAVANDQYVAFDGSTTYLSRSDLPQNVAMMEIVLKTDENGGNCVLTGFGRDYIGNINVVGTTGLVNFHTSTGSARSSNTAFNIGYDDKIHSFNSGGYLDGEAYTTTDSGADWQYTNPRIGCYKPTGANERFYKGQIYCIRLYSRILTEAEILANYNMDAIRFGLEA